MHDWTRVIAVLAILATASPVICADNWPMWRCDAQRSAASANQLPEELNLLWRKQFSPRKQAWDDPLNLDLMTYDRLFEPIVMDGRLFVGFNDQDKLVAFDASSGKELWVYFAEAPVRLPPVGWQDRIFFCSDDGFLYCVDAADGRLVWKFNGAPSSQHAIGNMRLTSAWPARGGPVVRDGTVYFAASIWPFMGTFIYALDADSGELRWVNDTTGSQYIKQPHSAPSFAGVAPQGALVATESLLLVPGGRSVPAVLDRTNGKLRYFELNAGGKGTGGSFVSADDEHFYVHTRRKGTRAFSLANGVKTAFMPSEGVLHGGMIYSAEVEKDKPLIRAYRSDESMAWEIEADGTGDLILAGHQLVAAGNQTITVIELPDADNQARITKSIAVEGQIERLLVAAEKLFAVTMDGQVLAFGDQQPSEQVTETTPAVTETTPAVVELSADEEQVVAELLSAGEASGYALWFGSCRSPRVRAVAARSPFTQLAVIDPDQDSVDQMRTQLDARGIYGSITVHHSEAMAFQAPKYVANMVFVDQADKQAPKVLTKIYESVRPYGGILYLLTSQDPQELTATIDALQLEQANVAVAKHGLIVRREGALPGSADWTHQYGDIANTVKSNDQRVKLPLGVLWFGGSSNMDVLPRHGHGPPEQVVGGRLFIQGMNCLSARDVYTGRVLWKREFPGLDTFDVFYDKTYDNTPLDTKYNQVHIPGANARGTNYVVTEDRVYLVEGEVCHAIDPATGKTLAEIRLPKTASGQREQWGYIGVYQDVLIGGRGFAMYRDRNSLTFPADQSLKANQAGFGSKSLDRAASVALVGFDRHSGEQLWSIDAKHSFLHNGIVAGNGKIYCLDKNPKKIEDALRRRGKSRPDSYRIVAMDYLSGEVVWEIKENVFGTWLGYSEQHDLLLQAGAEGSDRLHDEVAQGMAVYSGTDGSVVWENNSLKYAGPCILHNELIITNANSYAESAGAFYLKTGAQKFITNPLTGESQPWKLKRAYGCNNIIASENLLTFRSGAAGFYDLLTEAGTGNLGGFKSGCTSNLVVANGVLNAPDYTRTCSCAYQNQTSLALVHMPDIELWSVDNTAASTARGKSIRSLAINFGAPGDRRDSAGALWLEYPVVAGDSPPLAIQFNPEAKFFRQHESAVADVDEAWILASGVEDVTDIRLEMRLQDEYNLASGIPVQHVDDDAEEQENGDVDLSSNNLEFVEDAGTRIVGLRFNQINIARGTKIRGAHLQFTCAESSDDESSLIIAAENVGNASRFSSQRHDLSSRSLTRQEVGWKPGAWKKMGESNQLHRTPDLARLVQAVIDRPDWQAGNSLAFQISGAGKRIASSAKAGNGKAPKLIIDAQTTPARSAEPAQLHDVRLYLSVPRQAEGGIRVFDVWAQGKRVAEDVTLDPDGKRGETNVELSLVDIPIAAELHLRFIAKQGRR